MVLHILSCKVRTPFILNPCSSDHVSLANRQDGAKLLVRFIIPWIRSSFDLRLFASNVGRTPMGGARSRAWAWTRRGVSPLNIECHRAEEIMKQIIHLCLHSLLRIRVRRSPSTADAFPKPVHLPRLSLQPQQYIRMRFS